MFDPSLLALVYQVFKDFGCNALLGGIIVWLLWKIATNHLHHIALDIKTIGTDVKTVIATQEADKKELNEKIEAIDEKANTLGVKVAKLEGQVEK